MVHASSWIDLIYHFELQKVVEQNGRKERQYDQLEVVDTALEGDKHKVDRNHAVVVVEEDSYTVAAHLVLQDREADHGLHTAWAELDHWHLAHLLGQQLEHERWVRIQLKQEQTLPERRQGERDIAD